ncbi:MAG: ABC transporter permease [SAR86 cluster bacterium]|uniref:ABC transporter permease n=1 Tax=SAR86 cluster bacterium TaxID=2030880 RepID=A0A2A5C7J2_9GAMM|nr:MAG: ABC transporter permease [SAR86 cluster bacterium]
MTESSKISANESRPEIFNDHLKEVADIQAAPQGMLQRLYALGALRKFIILILLALAWEIYARSLNNPLIFPTFTATAEALFAGILSGELLRAGAATIWLLVQGYGLGLLLAILLTILASITKIGADLLETLTAMFNPLPSIAMLPLAMVWFGLGNGSVIFVLVHAVLWAVALNTFSGFKSVSPTLRLVGQNYGLTGPGYIFKILIPGAFASILTGLKVGWAFAWRTLIAAELVFGASSGSGGLGWFLFQKKNELLITEVFAGLLTIIIFGLLIENLVFKTIENKTLRRWGMLQ